MFKSLKEHESLKMAHMTEKWHSKCLNSQGLTTTFELEPFLEINFQSLSSSLRCR